MIELDLVILHPSMAEMAYMCLLSEPDYVSLTVAAEVDVEQINPTHQ